MRTDCRQRRRILVGNFEEHLPNGASLGFGESWKFFDDVHRAHDLNLMALG